MAASGNVDMISWSTRVLQARANLNGGELDERLPSDHNKKRRKDGTLPRTGLNGGERGAVPQGTERRMWKTNLEPA